MRFIAGQFSSTLALLVTVGVLGALPASAAPPLRCPDRVTVDEQIQSPQGWIADPAQREHRFLRISIFNGTMGEQHKAAPTELAPDTETRRGKLITQTWRLRDYRDANILLLCRYQGTNAQLAIDVPSDIETCEQTFEWDKKKGAVENPVTDPTMMCR